MKYLPCTNYKDAEDRSRALWDAIRPPAQRLPEDVTKFLLAIEGDGKSGFSLRVEPENETKISVLDRATLTTVKPVVEEKLRLAVEGAK